MEDNIEKVNGAEAPTPAEIQDALGAESPLPEIAMFSAPEERAIALRILPLVQMKAIAAAKASAEAEKAKEMKAFVDKLIEENQAILKQKIEEIQKSLTPPTAEELQKLLSQEYVEYTIQLRYDGKPRDFVIRELPLDAETRLLKAIQKTLAKRMKEVASIDWQAGSNTLVERIVKIVEIVPGAVDTLAECCAVCLDPLGEDENITGRWVQKNLGLNRLANILVTQMEVGRYRDFFSHVSRLFPGMTMTS